ncbi:MAG: GNAT family N-acetyltransferase, partial [Chlorobiales bacterium]|nr:GNAT family N-acetyltransferase [Chlorobiales bacterium]
CGHHPQISVMPSHHGKGLGAWLVDESLRRFKKAGFSNVSLTVTEKNEKADAWYRRVGYAQTLGFNAYLWLR